MQFAIDKKLIYSNSINQGSNFRQSHAVLSKSHDSTQHTCGVSQVFLAMDDLVWRGGSIQYSYCIIPPRYYRPPPNKPEEKQNTNTSTHAHTHTHIEKKKP